MISSPIYKWGNWNTEKLSDLDNIIWKRQEQSSNQGHPTLFLGFQPLLCLYEAMCFCVCFVLFLSKCENISFLENRTKLFSPTDVILATYTVSLGESNHCFRFGIQRENGPSEQSSTCHPELMAWAGTCSKRSALIWHNPGCPSTLFYNVNFSNLEAEAQPSANPVPRTICNPYWQTF